MFEAAAASAVAILGGAAVTNAVGCLAGDSSLATTLLAASLGPTLVLAFGAIFWRREVERDGVSAITELSVTAAVVAACAGAIMQLLVVGLGVSTPWLQPIGAAADTLAAVLFLPAVVASWGARSLQRTLWAAIAVVTLAVFSAICVVVPTFRESDYLWVLAVAFPAALSLAFDLWDHPRTHPFGRAESWSVIGAVAFLATLVYYAVVAANDGQPAELFAAYYLILVMVFASLAPTVVVALIEISRGRDRALAVHIAVGLLLLTASIVPGWVPPWGNDARTWAQRLDFLEFQAYSGLAVMLTAAIHHRLDGPLRRLWWAWTLIPILWAVMTWRHTPYDIADIGAPVAVVLFILSLLPLLPRALRRRARP